MKIWVKIFLFVFVITMISVQLVLFIVTDKLKEQILDLHGEKLKAIAISAATHIDSRIYEMIDFTDSVDITENEYYQKVRNQLIDIKNGLGLNEQIYTLNKIHDTAAVFGIMTNKNLFVGDTLHLISKTAKEAFQKVYETKRADYTDLYEDQYGIWITGLAPIILNDDVVGVIQVDHESSFIYAEFNKIEDYINYFRLISIPVLLLLSIALSKFISRPISKITARIDKIAKGDYSEQNEIKTSGELKQLVNSTEVMRKTILEQQSKIFQSLSDLKTAYTNLEAAKAKVDASDKLKSEFLTLISHEIRTPLNVMIGNLDFLRTEFASLSKDERQEIFDSVKSGSNRLMRTIDLIVTLAEIQSGSYETDFASVDLDNLISEILISFKDRVAEKQIKINFNNSLDSAVIEGDFYSVKQIANNLIDNALKFTHKGNVEIKISSRDNDIVLEVIDTGIGISEEFIPKIYDPFKQEESGYTRKYDGNGLGLTLAKECAKLNNCNIEAISEKGKGSTFRVTFSSVNKIEQTKETRETGNVAT